MTDPITVILSIISFGFLVIGLYGQHKCYKTQEQILMRLKTQHCPHCDDRSEGEESLV